MTTKQIEEIRRRHEAGENDHIIAEAIGYSVMTIWKWRKELGLPPIEVSGLRIKPVYCVWDAAYDTLLAFGTSKQCAEMLGMKCGSASFNQLRSKYKAGKIKKYIIMEAE